MKYTVDAVVVHKVECPECKSQYVWHPPQNSSECLMCHAQLELGELHTPLSFKKTKA